MPKRSTNMDQGVRGYIVNTARRNFWRVSEFYEFEDLLQDGAMVWSRVCNRYENVRDIKQRMALFKVAYANHIHDLSRKKSQLNLVREADLAAPLDFLRDCEDPEQDPDLVMLIKQLPPKIARILQRLYAEGREHPYRVRLEGRETTNARLCRLAGLDPDLRHIREAVQAYFDGAQIHPAYD
jgi:hypothetical protein